MKSIDELIKIVKYSLTGKCFRRALVKVLTEINNNGTNKPINVTYAELKELRDSGKLFPGSWYRITDYECTTTQEESRAVSHPFDIMVVADDEHTLNENARACLHDGDTYYSADDCKADLASWELKYSIDNDTNRFMWADAENGKGVIYWLKDDWGNECPYDFKQIQFKRYKITECEKVPGLVGAWGCKEISSITVDEDDFIWCYTFSYIPNNNAIEDISVKQYSYTDDEDVYRHCYGNLIKTFYNIEYSEESASNEKAALNNISFISTEDYDGGLYYGCNDNTFGNDCYINTFGSSCGRNTFGSNCHHNTFGNDGYINTLGNDCHHNTFGNDCYINTFESGCNDNTLGNDCQHNTFGNDFDTNTFDRKCIHNTFGSGCHGNTFGEECSNNTFGSRCYLNTVGTQCKNNTFGSSCYSNTFGDRFENNTFGIECFKNTFGDECRTNTFETQCNNNTFGDTCNNNTFSNGCGYNTFGDDCNDNTFSNSCDHNTFGNACANNTFDNGCSNNAFEDDCLSNAFGNSCNNNTFGNGCISNTLNDGVRYVTLSNVGGSGTVNNYHILTGTAGTSASRIVITGSINLSYCTYVGMNSSGEVKTWVPADAV